MQESKFHTTPDPSHDTGRVALIHSLMKHLSSGKALVSRISRIVAQRLLEPAVTT